MRSLLPIVSEYAQFHPPPILSECALFPPHSLRIRPVPPPILPECALFSPHSLRIRKVISRHVEVSLQSFKRT
jgi:hypothetical protein